MRLGGLARPPKCRGRRLFPVGMAELGVQEEGRVRESFLQMAHGCGAPQRGCPRLGLRETSRGATAGEGSKGRGSKTVTSGPYARNRESPGCAGVDVRRATSRSRIENVSGLLLPPSLPCGHLLSTQTPSHRPKGSQ